MSTTLTMHEILNLITRIVWCSDFSTRLDLQGILLDKILQLQRETMKAIDKIQPTLTNY